jgi:hypothetical protein
MKKVRPECLSTALTERESRLSLHISSKRLEEIWRSNEQKQNKELLAPRIADELAHQQMPLRPKLAGI